MPKTWPKPRDLKTFKCGRLSVRVTRQGGGTLLVDFLSDDEPDILYTVRLDREEGTLTVYDPAADESETVYEPDRQRPDAREVAERAVSRAARAEGRAEAAERGGRG